MSFSLAEIKQLTKNSKIKIENDKIAAIKKQKEAKLAETKRLAKQYREDCYNLYRNCIAVITDAAKSGQNRYDYDLGIYNNEQETYVVVPVISRQRNGIHLDGFFIH